MAVIADLDRDTIVSRLLALKPQLLDCGVTQLAIFGSRARGDHYPESDLDILIDVERNRKFSLLDLVGVSHVIGDALGLAANVFMRRSIEPQMVDAIRTDIIEVF